MERLTVSYRVTCPATEVEAFARSLALEQSVEVPLEAVFDAAVREHVVGRVEAITPLDAGRHRVDISLAVATTGFDPAQTINMLYGNSSMHPGVEWVDMSGGASLARALGGPRYGLAGLRERFGVHGRPFTCGAIKPQGLSVDRLADIAHRLALGGLDVIKDDHGLADQSYSPFATRVAACQRAISQANRDTGGKTVYAPSLVGPPKKLYEYARICREEGVGAVLMAPGLNGLPAFHEIVREHVQVPVLAHPGFGGATRIAPPMLLGKLFRMYGADAVIYPNFGGRFAYPAPLCDEIAKASLAPWLDLPAVVPVPAGGMTVERVPELLAFYGRDVMLLIGGSLLTAGAALTERTRAFVSTVHATA